MLGNLFEQCGIRFDECQVPLFGGGAEGIVNAPVRRNVIAFQEKPEEPLHPGHFPEHLLSCVLLDHQNVGVLKRLDGMRRRRSGEKTAEVGNPPVLDCKLQDMLFALVVDCEFAQAAASDERQMFADFSLPEKKLSLPE